MAYTKKIWKDYPDTTTPIKAEDLNNIENGIEEIDTGLETVTTGLETVTTISKILGLDVDTYNSSTNYEVDDFVVYQKELWRCTNATTGEWKEEDWERDSILVSSN